MSSYIYYYMQVIVTVEFIDAVLVLPTTLYSCSESETLLKAHLSELVVDVRDPGPYMVRNNISMPNSSCTRSTLQKYSHIYRIFRSNYLQSCDIRARPIVIYPHKSKGVRLSMSSLVKVCTLFS